MNILFFILIYTKFHVLPFQRIMKIILNSVHMNQHFSHALLQNYGGFNSDSIIPDRKLPPIRQSNFVPLFHERVDYIPYDFHCKAYLPLNSQGMRGLDHTTDFVWRSK